MLNEVLTHHKPDSWDSESYTNKRYKQVQVFGMEHSRVLEEFSSDLRSRVESVYRVQNPYLYGRYKLRVEQLQLRNGNVYEEKWYHPIAEDDMNVVMEYNCDYRRYTNPSMAQYSSKKPRFYKTPEAAERECPHANKALVVLKVASTSSYSFSSECYKEWDTEYYPEYIVVLT